MSGPNENVMARIRKMLALANDNGATEGERDNALRMVYNILAKYNLSMEQVEASGQVTEEERKSESFEFRQSVWARLVCMSAAELFFCEHYFDHNTDKHVLVGRVSNVATASEMAKWLIEAISREATRYSNGRGIRYTNSFARGAAHKISLRVKEIRVQGERAEPGQEIVLASLYNREKLANGALLPDSLRTRVTRSRVNGDAYSRGESYGAGVNLHRQVSGSVQRTAIGKVGS